MLVALFVEVRRFAKENVVDSLLCVDLHCISFAVYVVYV
jgi:hypothetical protein